MRELVAEPLDIAMATTHPLAARENLTAEEVADATWIGVPHGYPFDTVLASIENRLGRPLRVAQRVRDNRLIEELVATSNRLAVLPRFTTRHNENLALRPITDVPAVRHMSAVMRPDRAQRRSVRAALLAVADASQAQLHLSN